MQLKANFSSEKIRSGLLVEKLLWKFTMEILDICTYKYVNP